MFLSFADVMCFFISVYLLIRVSEKCQNILFLLLKRRKILDFHRFGIPSYFSFPKQSFIASHTIISEVCFNNREFILFFGVIFGVILSITSIDRVIVNLLQIICKSSVLGVILGVILCFLGVTLTVILGVIYPFWSIIYNR